MNYEKPKYIVAVLTEEGRVVMATHKLFPDEITAYEHAASMTGKTVVVIEVRKQLYEGEERD